MLTEKCQFKLCIIIDFNSSIKIIHNTDGRANVMFMIFYTLFIFSVISLTVVLPSLILSAPVFLYRPVGFTV